MVTCSLRTTLFVVNRLVRNVSYTGKQTVLVTGANTGMGLETALQLARSDARVIIGCRNMSAGRQAVEKITRITNNKDVTVYKLDLASFASIRSFACEINQEEAGLNVLINNAGVFMLPLRRTSDNIEMHFGVNYLGHFLLTNLLLDKLKATPPARIVNIASRVPLIPFIDLCDINSEKSYNRVKAVLQSKQAILLYTKYLSSKLKNCNVMVNSVDPGLVLNAFGRNRDYWYGYFQLVFYPLLMALLQPPAKGCQSAVYGATSQDLVGVSGKHIVNCKLQDIPLPLALDMGAAETLHDISTSLTSTSDGGLHSKRGQSSGSI